MDEIPEFVARQIAATVERLLRQAGVAGVFPTPLDALEPVAGIREVVDIGDLPDELRTAKPNAMRRILGALLYRTDTAFVDGTQPGGRRRFIRAHEIAHRALPWHEDSYHLDDEIRLFRETEELLEHQANVAAAQILFQGNRFHAQALDYEHSLKTPIRLAPDFDTSYHATIRYYVERHPEPMAVIVAGRFRAVDGGLPIWSSIESPRFHQQFGPFTRHLPAARLVLPPPEAEDPEPFGATAREAITSVDVVAREIVLRDLAGDRLPFVLEGFFNQRCVFLLARPRRLFHLGRRVQVVRRAI